MDITRKALNSLPDEWLLQLASECDPDGDLDRDGYSPSFIVWQSIDSPDIREQVSEMLSTLNEEVSHVY
jgi:hypothetical protein